MVYHRSMRCPGGEIGRHKGFKIPRLSSRAGSSPARGTITLKILSTSYVEHMAPWQSGYAADCKSVDLGSTPGGASISKLKIPNPIKFYI